MDILKTLGLSLLLLLSTLFLIDLSMHLTNYFVSDATISKTVAWTLAGSFTGAVTSFVLLMSWDKYKNHSAMAQKDELILNNISHELEACFISCMECKNHLEIDMINMSDNQSSTPKILPPPKLKLNIWELLKYHIPKYIKNTPNKLYELRYASNLIAHFNHQLNSRIEYQIHGVGHSDIYMNNIRTFDKDLLNVLKSKVLPVINDLTTEFDEFSVDNRSDKDTRRYHSLINKKTQDSVLSGSN